MKHVRIAASICLLLVGLSAFCVSIETRRYLRTLNAVTAELPKVAQSEIAATRETLRTEIVATRSETLRAVGRLQTTADARLAAIQSDAAKGLESASVRIDARLGEATATLAGIRSDVRPVLTETAATVKDARDTVDALYPDTLALMDTVDVTARSVSETMGAVEKAAPRIADSAAQNGENIAGITHDVHVITARLTKPATVKARIWEAVKVAALVARFF